MLSDPMVCTALMDAAGFTDVHSDEISSYFSATAPSDMFEFMRKCASACDLPIRSTIACCAKGKIEQALRDQGAKAMALDGGKIPCPALLVSGVKTKA
jgi:hypothetical protein